MINKTKTIKELEPLMALAKIKARIEKYFSDIGRDVILDTEQHKIDCIDYIDETLDKVEIPSKYLVVEQLEIDDDERKKEKKFRNHHNISR